MTKQEFEQFSLEMKASGMSQKGFISERGLPLHQYYYWKKKYGNSEQKSPNKFIQINSVESINSEIRLEYPNGVVLNIQSSPGSKILRKLINLKH